MIQEHHPHPDINLVIQKIAFLLMVYHDGGDCASPFILPLGPSILGTGFRAAFTVFCRGMFGTPCRTRGSFIRVGSSFVGAVASQYSAVKKVQGWMEENEHTSGNDCSNIPWNPTFGGGGCCCSPKMIIGVGEEVRL